MKVILTLDGDNLNPSGLPALSIRFDPQPDLSNWNRDTFLLPDGILGETMLRTLKGAGYIDYDEEVTGDGPKKH